MIAKIDVIPSETTMQIDAVTFVDNVSPYLHAYDLYNLRFINRSFFEYVPDIYDEQHYDTLVDTIKNVKIVLVDREYASIFRDSVYIKDVPIAVWSHPVTHTYRVCHMSTIDPKIELRDLPWSNDIRTPYKDMLGILYMLYNSGTVFVRFIYDGHIVIFGRSIHTADTLSTYMCCQN